jgi:hypothetical protein
VSLRNVSDIAQPASIIKIEAQGLSPEGDICDISADVCEREDCTSAMTKGLSHWVLSATILAMAGVGSNAMALGYQAKDKKSQIVSPEVQGLSAETLGIASSLSADAPTSSLDKTSKSYSLNLKGRWGVKVDVSQAPARPSGWSDVDAGAFFKVTPSLRVGGTVGFGPKTTNALTPANTQNKAQPRVRVETTFNF